MLDRVLAARETLSRVVSETCGACLRNCCHAGTLVGTRDLPRLAKGLRLYPDFRSRFTAGLAGRAEELRADLDLLRSQALLPLSEGAELAFQQWSHFCDSLEDFDPLDHMALRSLLTFSAIRAIAHRCAQIPIRPPRGSEAVPVPLRCLLDLEGCLAEQFKPVTCASFFCPAEPGVISALRAQLSFDDFCLANMRPLSGDGLYRVFLLELQRPFVREAKTVIGSPEIAQVALDRACAESGVEPPRVTVSALNQTALAHLEHALPTAQSGPSSPPSGTASSQTAPLVLIAPALDGRALYDVSLRLTELARSHPHASVWVLAPAFLLGAAGHPMWESAAMGQPVGGPEIIYTAPS